MLTNATIAAKRLSVATSRGAALNSIAKTLGTERDTVPRLGSAVRDPETDADLRIRLLEVLDAFEAEAPLEAFKIEKNRLARLVGRDLCRAALELGVSRRGNLAGRERDGMLRRRAIDAAEAKLLAKVRELPSDFVRLASEETLELLGRALGVPRLEFATGSREKTLEGISSFRTRLLERAVLLEKQRAAAELERAETELLADLDRQDEELDGVQAKPLDEPAAREIVLGRVKVGIREREEARDLLARLALSNSGVDLDAFRKLSNEALDAAVERLVAYPKDDGPASRGHFLDGILEVLAEQRAKGERGGAAKDFDRVQAEALEPVLEADSGDGGRPVAEEDLPRRTFDAEASKALDAELRSSLGVAKGSDLDRVAEIAGVRRDFAGIETDSELRTRALEKLREEADDARAEAKARGRDALLEERGFLPRDVWSFRLDDLWRVAEQFGIERSDGPPGPRSPLADLRQSLRRELDRRFAERIRKDLLARAAAEARGVASGTRAPGPDLRASVSVEPTDDDRIWKTTTTIELPSLPAPEVAETPEQVAHLEEILRAVVAKGYAAGRSATLVDASRVLSAERASLPPSVPKRLREVLERLEGVFRTNVDAPAAREPAEWKTLRLGPVSREVVEDKLGELAGPGSSPETLRDPGDLAREAADRVVEELERLAATAPHPRLRTAVLFARRRFESAFFGRPDPRPEITLEDLDSAGPSKAEEREAVDLKWRDGGPDGEDSVRTLGDLLRVLVSLERPGVATGKTRGALVKFGAVKSEISGEPKLELSLGVRVFGANDKLEPGVRVVGRVGSVQFGGGFEGALQ